MSPQMENPKSLSPGIFHSFLAKGEDLPASSGNGLCVLTFPLQPCLLSESPRRAYRHCLAQGTWQTRENATTIWQDDSECSGNYSFKQKVSLPVFCESTWNRNLVQPRGCQLWGTHTWDLPPARLLQIPLGKGCNHPTATPMAATEFIPLWDET